MSSWLCLGSSGAVGCPGEGQCRLENQVSCFLLGTKAQRSGFGAPRGDSPCGLCVGSDLIVPLRDAALCNLHIKRPPLFTTPLLGCGREDGLIIELTHSIKRHPWLSESLVGGIVLGTKLKAPSFSLLDCST